MGWRDILDFFGLKNIKKGKREHFYYGEFEGLIIKKKDGTEIIISIKSVLRLLIFVVLLVLTWFYGLKLGAEFQKRVDSCISFQYQLYGVKQPIDYIKEDINRSISTFIIKENLSKKYGLENKTNE